MPRNDVYRPVGGKAGLAEISVVIIKRMGVAVCTDEEEILLRGKAGVTKGTTKEKEKEKVTVRISEKGKKEEKQGRNETKGKERKGKERKGKNVANKRKAREII